MSETLGLPTPPVPTLSPRPSDAHKGNFGHALVIGGSRPMAGSISLSASSALHAGAGLVTQAVADCIVGTVAVLNPCAMTLPLASDAQGRIAEGAFEMLAEHFSRATAVGCGPGLGRSPALQKFMRRLVTEVPLPCVVDADGLNNMADSGAWPTARAQPRILTPHPGEWSRLCGIPASDTSGQRAAAVQFAKEHGAIVVLKGHHTLVTDGDSAWLNTTGTPAMASGGSGDVLTGAIVALICQGLSPRDAAQLAVYAHGLAGELAQQATGARVVLASQLIEKLDAALATRVVSGKR